MADPIEIDRDDGSRLALSRAVRTAWIGWRRWRGESVREWPCAECGLCRCDCEREARRDG